MRIAGIFACALAAFLLCGTVFAQETAAPAASDAEMKAQLEKASADLGAAMRRIEELEAKVGAVCIQMDAANKDVSSLSGQMKTLEDQSRVTSAPPVAGCLTPYGYIKFDMIYDDTRSSGTDYTAFALPDTAKYGNDKYFSMTARQTRFGVNIAGPDVEGATSSGKIEIDFYAPASVENKPELMLRQAYWQLAYPNWSILAGQTWEVMSPLAPNSINYAYLALQGNAGYRKPMLRYERKDAVWGDKTLQTDLALVRGIGSSTFSTASLDDQASDAAWPVIEARAGLSFPTSVGRPMAFGISGHIGQEEYDETDLASGPEYMTYSGNLDWVVPISKAFDFTGEFFVGRNMDAYTGGIGQGVNTDLGKPIDAIGGWGQLAYHPDAKWYFSVGAGIDDPDNADLSANFNRACNAVYFANTMYNINARTRVGVEVSFQDTQYVYVGADGDNVRVQGSLQYNF